VPPELWKIIEALYGRDIMSFQISLQDSARQFPPFQQMSIFATLASKKYFYLQSVFFVLVITVERQKKQIGPAVQTNIVMKS
jgi:hypothetical protein